MTAQEARIYDILFSGGNWARQYLIKLSHPTAGTLYYVNNNEDVTYGGVTYKACGFDYTRPDVTGQGGSLKITGADNGALIEWIDKADYRYQMDVVGILNGNEVQEIRAFRHFFGSVSFGENNEVTFSMEGDDRLNMVFTAYKYDTDTNRGNA